MKHQQLKFDLRPTSQRCILEIQRSKYPDSKSKYEHFRTFSNQFYDNAIKEFNRLKSKYPGYRFRVRKLTYQKFEQEVLAKVEYLK